MIHVHLVETLQNFPRRTSETFFVEFYDDWFGSPPHRTMTKVKFRIVEPIPFLHSP